MHLITFVLNRQIYKLEDKIPEENETDDYQRADQIDRHDDENIYRPIKRVFYSKMWWVWFVQAIVYAGVIGLYFKIKGIEIVF